MYAFFYFLEINRNDLPDNDFPSNKIKICIAILNNIHEIVTGKHKYKKVAEHKHD